MKVKLYHVHFPNIKRTILGGRVGVARRTRGMEKCVWEGKGRTGNFQSLLGVI